MREKQIKAKIKAATVKPAASGTEKKAAKKTSKEVEKKEIPGKTETDKVTPKIKLVSTEELAAFVGVTPRRIQQLTQQGIIEKEPGTEKYDFVRSVHSLLQYYRPKADSRKSGDSEEMSNEKLKQISAKRKLEELKLAQLEGELHKAEDIERIMGAVLTRLRINLLAIPMGVAPILRDMDDVREIAEKIDERIRRSMNEVADLDLKKLVEEDNSVAGDYANP